MPSSSCVLASSKRPSSVPTMLRLSGSNKILLFALLLILCVYAASATAIFESRRAAGLAGYGSIRSSVWPRMPLAAAMISSTSASLSSRPSFDLRASSSPAFHILAVLLASVSCNRKSACAENDGCRVPLWSNRSESRATSASRSFVSRMDFSVRFHAAASLRGRGDRSVAPAAVRPLGSAMMLRFDFECMMMRWYESRRASRPAQQIRVLACTYRYIRTSL